MCFRYPGIRSQRKSRIIRTSRVELVPLYTHFSSARFAYFWFKHWFPSYIRISCSAVPRREISKPLMHLADWINEVQLAALSVNHPWLLLSSPAAYSFRQWIRTTEGFRVLCSNHTNKDLQSWEPLLIQGSSISKLAFFIIFSLYSICDRWWSKSFFLQRGILDRAFAHWRPCLVVEPGIEEFSLFLGVTKSVGRGGSSIKGRKLVLLAIVPLLTCPLLSGCSPWFLILGASHCTDSFSLLFIFLGKMY